MPFSLGSKTVAQDRDSIQSEINAVDREISDITANINRATSQSAIEELNRQLKEREGRRSQLLFDLYLAEVGADQQQKMSESLRAEREALERGIRDWREMRAMLDEDVQAHQQEFARMEDAVAQFNALPADRQTDSEMNRLNVWIEDLNNRADRLNEVDSELKKRLADLLAWGDGLDRELMFEPPSIADDPVLLDQIKHHEGVRNEVYLDSRNIPTIGIGFNLQRGDAKQRIESLGLNFDDVLAGRQSLTDEQVQALFVDDVRNAADRAPELVSNFDDLPVEKQRIVVDMIFNLGAEGFRKFAKMRQALERNDFAAAADEMENSLWYKQVGNRAKSLVQAMREQ